MAKLNACVVRRRHPGPRSAPQAWSAAGRRRPAGWRRHIAHRAGRRRDRRAGDPARRDAWRHGGMAL